MKTLYLIFRLGGIEMKKTIILTLAIAAVMSCCTGCSNGSANKEQNTNSKESSAVTVSADDVGDADVNEENENAVSDSISDEDDTQGSYTLSEYINSGKRLILYYMKSHTAKGESDRTTLGYPAKDEVCNKFYVFEDGKITKYYGDDYVGDKPNDKLLKFKELSKMTDDEIVQALKERYEVIYERSDITFAVFTDTTGNNVEYECIGTSYIDNKNNIGTIEKDRLYFVIANPRNTATVYDSHYIGITGDSSDCLWYRSDNLFLSIDNMDTEGVWVDPEPSKTSEKDFSTVKKLFPFITDDGRAKDTAAQNEEAINAAGIYTVKDISPENIEANTDNRTLFRLGIKNTEGLLKYKEKYYIPTKIKDQTYMVVFGDENTTTPEEIAPYARKNSHTAYYGYAIKSGSGYAFIPLIAGSDESGYFIVKPTFKYIGFDMTDMPDLPADTIIGTGLDEPIEME